jgi:hypothetical protein
MRTHHVVKGRHRYVSIRWRMSFRPLLQAALRCTNRPMNWSVNYRSPKPWKYDDDNSKLNVPWFFSEFSLMDNDNKHVWPTLAVGALFRGLSSIYSHQPRMFSLQTSPGFRASILTNGKHATVPESMHGWLPLSLALLSCVVCDFKVKV